MNRREFVAGLVAAVAGGKPLAVLVSQRAGKKFLFDAMRTTKLEAACLPTMGWTTARTGMGSNWIWRTRVISRAEVEAPWPSRPDERA